MNKAISLDFWGTIAVFNPEYAAARTDYLAALFGLPRDEAHARYQYIKRGFDHQAEHFGSATTPLGAVKLLIDGMTLTKARDAVSILDDIEALVRRHPPLLNERISPTISKLQEKGYVVGVASNTNFIRGALVQDIFNLPWEFAVYSDEIGVSKPDADFYRMGLRGARRATPAKLEANDLLHIGDNTACDVRGAERVGMRGLLTKSPSQTVAILQEIINGTAISAPELEKVEA